MYDEDWGAISVGQVVELSIEVVFKGTKSTILTKCAGFVVICIVSRRGGQFLDKNGQRLVKFGQNLAHLLLELQKKAYEFECHHRYL